MRDKHTPSEERDGAGNLDLVDRLSVKAAMISLGEKIAWGSEVGLMHEAAAEITRLRADVERKDEALKPFAEAAAHAKAAIKGSAVVAVYDRVAAYYVSWPDYARAALEQEGA